MQRPYSSVYLILNKLVTVTFPSERLPAILSPNTLPNTAFPAALLLIAPLYRNPRHHPIAATPSVLTRSRPTSTLVQPLQTAPSHSAQSIGNLIGKDLANLLTISHEDPLPEWKLSNFDRNSLEWNDMF